MINGEASSKHIITKYVTPTKFDIAPLKTIWNVVKNDKSTEFYIQLSDDTNNPRWEKVGTFLEKSLVKLIDNKMFINECFRLFMHNEDNPHDKIAAILHDSKK